MYGFAFSVGRRNRLMSVNLGLGIAFGGGYDPDCDINGAKRRVDSDREVFLATVSTICCL